MARRSPTRPKADEPSGIPARPRVAGKFIFVGNEKLYLRGVTYGTFAPDANGDQYGTPAQVESDFAAMAASGINSVRTYTVPPRWLLDAAQLHGLYVMVGLPWEQHVAFLDTRKRRRSIENHVREGVRACAGHPALLAFTVGNEIPSPVVRWHGRRKVERFLERLYRAVKDEDPGALVTYVNYPSTEYVDVSFADFVCFNVYLEQRDRLEAYLARLQTLSGDRPVVMGEIGLDSSRNGEEAQAETLAWQVRTAFAEGCAGIFVFAWTDEWHRGGYDVEDWDFGLTDRDRSPKAALAAMRDAFADVPFPRAWEWPRISVVVASYNGARTIRETLAGTAALQYPDYEVIVVDDGSSDATPEIAASYGVRLISTENRGLSNARNTGMEAATGEIVAYLDDDARPDPHWLRYLAATFAEGGWACVGGPNIAPPGDGAIADCVTAAPGGPCQVLSTIARPSTSPAATWPSARTRSWPSAASTRASAWPATTSMPAGACWRRASASASAPPPSSGITAAARSAPTCASRRGMAAPKRCWSASGPRASTPRGTPAGPGGSTAAARRPCCASAAGASVTASGARRCSSPSTSPLRASSAACR